jgi:hypothetical protein
MSEAESLIGFTGLEMKRPEMPKELDWACTSFRDWLKK